jgi:glycine/D-amino acid oxidase-like deaminating enzyme/nitrite reductase/ring-hydroxylating ferredoxin subunit
MTTSPWQQGVRAEKYPALEANLKVDVVVVGGGITGITTAYLLVKAGKKVALLERGRLGEGATGWTTAFVTYVIDTPLTTLSKRFGLQRAALVWQSGRQAIDELERIITEEKIDCDFMRCPAYIYATDEAGLQKIHEESELARRLGFSVHLGEEPLGFTTRGHLRIDAQAKFNPLKFITALAAKSQALGLHIFENSPVTDCSHGPTCLVKTAQAEIRANDMVLATYMPLGDPDALSVRITASQTYILETKIKSGVLPEAIFWDTQTPYHYFRLDPFSGYDRLILGGEDHKTGHRAATPPDSRLNAYLANLLPAEKPEIVQGWSGEILETIDGLPYIGQAGQHRYVATGFSGNGMTFGVVSAALISDAILGKPNPFATLYKPRRFSGLVGLLGRFRNYLSGFLQGRFTPAPTMPTLAPDEGAIISVKNKKIAAYRTPDGNLIQMSAVCTHLGCIVAWNSAAKTWDCPCHGSRFKKEGEVLNGPAQKPLPRIDT